MADTMKRDDDPDTESLGGNQDDMQKPTSTQGTPGPQQPEGTAGQNPPRRSDEELNRGEEQRNQQGQQEPQTPPAGSEETDKPEA
jgi:hypothetical protein